MTEHRLSGRYYFIHSIGCIEPRLHGPFRNEKNRDDAAVDCCGSGEFDPEDDVVFWLNIGNNDVPQIGAYYLADSCSCFHQAHKKAKPRKWQIEQAERDIRSLG